MIYWCLNVEVIKMLEHDTLVYNSGVKTHLPSATVTLKQVPINTIVNITTLARQKIYTARPINSN